MTIIPVSSSISQAPTDKARNEVVTVSSHLDQLVTKPQGVRFDVGGFTDSQVIRINLAIKGSAHYIFFLSN
jgi:hypothetical protein